MDTDQLNELLDVPFKLKPRVVAISAELRPVRRLAILVLLLYQCRGKRANIEQLHVLNWAIKSSKSRTAFLDLLQGQENPDESLVRYDPSLSRVIAIALAEGLLDRPASEEAQHSLPPLRDVKEPQVRARPYRVILSEKGRVLAEQLHKETESLVEERQFLNDIGLKISQEHVHSLIFLDY